MPTFFSKTKQEIFETLKSILKIWAMNQSYAWRTRMSDWVSTNSSTSRQNCKNQIECLGYSKTSKDKQNPIDTARTGPGSYLSSDVFSEMSPVLEPLSPKLRNLRTTMATTRNMKTPLNGNTIWCVICHTIRMYSFSHIKLWIFCASKYGPSFFCYLLFSLKKFCKMWWTFLQKYFSQSIVI